MRPMTNGIWTIQFIDEDSHILVMSNSDGNITKGTTSLPKAGGMLGGTMYYSNCSTLTPNINLSPVSSLLGPGNMSYRTFNGVNQYMEYPDDPNLQFTGNMAISVWLDPLGVGNGDPNNTANWNTILGKGILFGVNNEDDNYQLVALGNNLYFEWTNADGNHYYSQTNGAALTNGAWQYVTVNVQAGGQPQIYVNGTLQTSTVYAGNTPQIKGASSSATVNLENVAYPLKIGKQNSDTNPFYYDGNIGSLALYNRALTTYEIQQNYQNYAA